MNKTEKYDLIGYAFIKNTFFHTGVTPSLREIGKAVGYCSPRSVQLMIERLKKKGLLADRNGETVIVSNKPAASRELTVDVPLVGSVPCGTPTLAEQEPETLFQLSTKIAKPGHRYFLLRADGRSMDKSGIKSGDLVLIRQQQTANNGDMVVALIDDKATIKLFYDYGDTIVLKPNSTDKIHKPIVLTDELVIQGVVVRSFPYNH